MPARGRGRLLMGGLPKAPRLYTNEFPFRIPGCPFTIRGKREGDKWPPVRLTAAAMASG